MPSSHPDWRGSELAFRDLELPRAQNTGHLRLSQLVSRRANASPERSAGLKHSEFSRRPIVRTVFHFVNGYENFGTLRLPCILFVRLRLIGVTPVSSGFSLAAPKS